MGPLLELLLVPLSVLNDFDDTILLSHRGFWFEVNPFGGMGALMTGSAYGRVINGEFRMLASTREQATHTVAELRAIVQSGGNFIAKVVEAHKNKVGH